ncbi:hypothetical protein KC902_04550, partial [Candidatus Kaiserbacteria bacterium]|nr:hypothetical protein [Candidatus Kaiserbacteria bacterium]
MRLKLSPHLKKAITESVSDLTISDAKVTRLTWDLASARILNTFLEVGVVSRDDLLKMIHQAI